MVLAEGVEGDVLEDHHLLVALLEADHELLAGVHAQAGEHLGVHLRDAPRGAGQALALGVITDGLDDLADGLAGSVDIDQGFSLGKS